EQNRCLGLTPAHTNPRRAVVPLRGKISVPHPGFFHSVKNLRSLSTQTPQTPQTPQPTQEPAGKQETQELRKKQKGEKAPY
ncbi:MAG TPA: hypothetical protein PLT37_07430, partial [Kiritimatiellia bacterium]|nr:hypothetical protein [Kiritimatiellia bacterium]HXK79385.1 hypothetical protein [Kiritimatiellia bacterium]